MVIPIEPCFCFGSAQCFPRGSNPKTLSQRKPGVELGDEGVFPEQACDDWFAFSP